MQRLGIRLNIAKLSTCQRPTTPQQHGCMRCRNYAIFNFQRHLIALSWRVIWLHCVSRCEDFVYCDNKSQIASLITCRHFCIHLNKKWIETLQKEIKFQFSNFMHSEHVRMWRPRESEILCFRRYDSIESLLQCLLQTQNTSHNNKLKALRAQLLYEFQSSQHK